MKDATVLEIDGQPGWTHVLDFAESSVGIR
jgi:hypothetical protein